VYGLVGPNGSGKTTTLELLAGLRQSSAGRIELGVAEDSVAYCPDAPEFEPWLTAVEVLDVASGLLGRPRSRAALGAMLEQVGLSEAAKRSVGGFSRGMRSRLGLAAGLIGEPKLLIADEPAAALDPAGRFEVIDVLAALAGSVTVLVSSHDLADVERICDRIGVLAKGGSSTRVPSASSSRWPRPPCASSSGRPQTACSPPSPLLLGSARSGKSNQGSW
jgi:ABC-2 type transport system ATP-binding protein